MLRDHSYLAHAELRSLAGIGEMFDTLLVYENFPPGGLVGGGEFTANGATFRPAALESLSHFPVTIAAHMIDDELTVLVEVIDGALGLDDPRIPRSATAGHRATADHALGQPASRCRHPARRRGCQHRSRRGARRRRWWRAHQVHRVAATKLGSTALSWPGGHLHIPRAGRGGRPARRSARRPRGAHRNPGGDQPFPRTRLRDRHAGCAEGGRRDRAAGPRDASRTRRRHPAADRGRRSSSTMRSSPPRPRNHTTTSGPRRRIPGRPRTWCSPPAPRASPRASSAPIRRCWPTPRTMRETSCGRPRLG